MCYPEACKQKIFNGLYASHPLLCSSQMCYNKQKTQHCLNTVCFPIFYPHALPVKVQVPRVNKFQELLEPVSLDLRLIQDDVVVRGVPVEGPEVLAEGSQHISVRLELELADDHGAVAEEAGFALLVQPLQQVLAVMGVLHPASGLSSVLGKRSSPVTHRISLFYPPLPSK